MCPQERLSLHKFSSSAYPLCSKGLGHLLHLSTIYFLCFYFLVAYTRKPIKSYLSVLAVIPCSRSLVITFRSSLGSTLLLIEKATIDPLHLWVITCPQCWRHLTCVWIAYSDSSHFSDHFSYINYFHVSYG